VAENIRWNETVVTEGGRRFPDAEHLEKNEANAAGDWGHGVSRNPRKKAMRREDCSLTEEVIVLER